MEINQVHFKCECGMEGYFNLKYRTYTIDPCPKCGKKYEVKPNGEVVPLKTHSGWLIRK